MIKLDAIDHQILKILSEDGRMPTVEIAERVGLSTTPCGRRIRQMEEAGVITGYTVNINPNALGKTICVLVSVKLSIHTPDGHAQFIQAVSKLPEVSECLLVTGSTDYLLKIWADSIDTLAEFIPQVLQGVPCVAETATTLVLKHYWAASIPIFDADRR